jgi:hypothetical protein
MPLLVVVLRVDEVIEAEDEPLALVSRVLELPVEAELLSSSS